MKKKKSGKRSSQHPSKAQIFFLKGPQEGLPALTLSNGLEGRAWAKF